MVRRKFDIDLIPPSPDLSFEEAIWGKGHKYIAGIDEAGRGSLAGPVVVAAVVFPPDLSLTESLDGVRDSKVMSPSNRGFWAKQIKEVSLEWTIGMASSEEIDTHGIVPATHMAVHRALVDFQTSIEYLLLDYLSLPDIPIPQEALVKGDARSLSISAASILAKTIRDKLLVEMDTTFPGYGFAQNKGYGTRYHREAIHRMGPCPIHRRSFAPVKDLLLLAE